MNAANIINDDMTLEEKLAAIDKAMEQAVENNSKIKNDAPVDPALAFVCDGCQ